MSLKLFMDGLADLFNVESKEQKERNDILNSVGMRYCPNNDCRAPIPKESTVCRYCNTKIRVKK